MNTDPELGHATPLVAGAPLPVLVATDESECARAAMRVAGALAAADRIIPEIIVVDPAPTLGTDRRTGVEAILREDGADRWPLRLRTGNAADRIVGDAVTGAFALIMLGLRQNAGLDRVLRRETTIQVTRHSPAPVFAVASWLHHIPRRIVVGLDFGRTSERAAALACRLLADGGTLTLAHTQSPQATPPEAWAGVFGRGTPDELSSLIDRLPLPPGAHVDTVPLSGSPTTELLELVDRVSADALAVGHQHRSMGVYVASVADALIRDARCSMLIVPPSTP